MSVRSIVDTIIEWLRSVIPASLPEAIGALIAAAILALVAYLYRKRKKRNVSETAVPGIEIADLEFLRDYLDQVEVSNSSLVFGDPTRSSMDATSSSSGVLVLSQVWTPLWVTAHKPAATGDFETPPIREILGKEDVEQVVTAVQRPENRHVLLLGDPGSGKSTVVSYLAVECAKEAKKTLKHLSDWTERDYASMKDVPVRVLLRDVLPSDPPALSDIWSGIPELAVLKGQGRQVDRLTHLLEVLLRDGKGLVLMDGLDEIREELLSGVKGVIGLVFSALGDSKVGVTCRTYDYIRGTPNRKINIPVTLRLLPFETEDMRAYVRNWYDAVVKIGRLDPVTAETLKGKLIRSLEHKDHPQLHALGRTPLLLTLLTLVHTEEGELPESRALVYHRAVKYLLAETAQWRRQAGGATVASAEMMGLAQHVAHVAHSELEKLGPEFRGLSLKQLTGIVADHFRLDDQPPGEAFEAASRKVNAHLTRLIQSNGLLVDQGGDRYSFAHRSFQEFLAGQYFAPGSHHAEALRAAKEAHWREAFRLLAGYGAREGSNLFYLLALIDDLAELRRSRDLPPANFTDPILAGEMLLEIGRDILVRSGYSRVLEPDGRTSGPTGLWFRTCRILVDLIERVPAVLPTVERIRAAYAVGQLGDLRFIDETGRLRPMPGRLIKLPALVLTMGSPVGVGKDDERPRRTFRFPEFWAAKYLVTNLEFAEFLDSGAYENSEWWETEEAKKWLAGDRDFLETVEKLWVETVTEYHAKELRDKEIRVEDLANEAEVRCRARREPFYWRNSRFNKPNQPVVGINWWEARAFCAWLTGKVQRESWLPDDEKLRLPTEFEWERSSKDKNDDRLYPWGNEWSHDKAHTREDGLSLNEATPVGVYPSGTWVGGPLDLSANVWEWLENLKLPYDELHDEARVSVFSLEDRAIRGSSWYNIRFLARCSARFVDRPYNLYYDVGFRVVRVKSLAGLMPPSVGKLTT